MVTRTWSPPAGCRPTRHGHIVIAWARVCNQRRDEGRNAPGGRAARLHDKARPRATSGTRHARTASNRISAGRSALRIAGRGTQELLPHQAGPVGGLLLGQAGRGGEPAGAVAGAETLRRKFW